MAFRDVSPKSSRIAPRSVRDRRRALVQSASHYEMKMITSRSRETQCELLAQSTPRSRQTCFHRCRPGNLFVPAFSSIYHITMVQAYLRPRSHSEKHAIHPALAPLQKPKTPWRWDKKVAEKGADPSRSPRGNSLYEQPIRKHASIVPGNVSVNSIALPRSS